MSASQQKKRRQAGADTSPEAVEKRKNEKSIRGMSIAIISIIAVLILATVFINSNLFYTGMDAVKIGGKGYNVAEFNYYYNTTYSGFMSQYGDLAGMLGLDTSKSLDSQEFMEGQTWADYFETEALASMQRVDFLYDEAMRNGYELSEQSKSYITGEVDVIKLNYALYGFNSVEQFVTYNYGKGATIELLEELMTKNYLANEYAQTVGESYEYSQQELDDYYVTKKDEYDFFSFRQFFFSGAADDEAGIDAETAMAEAKEKAEAMASGIGTEEDFARLALENASADTKESYENDEATLNRTQGNSLHVDYSEWLLDAAREKGDITTAEASNGYYVLYFIGRDDNSYATRNVRHILVKAVAEEDGSYTDEAKQTALETAEQLLEDWKAGEATEDSFATLANEKSEDSGSNTNGGLYERVYKNQMVAEFDSFLFDESREPGDTGIVYGESGSYAGYHVMYYVGEDIPYKDTLADTDLRNEQYQAWLEAGVETYPVEKKFAFRFAR